MSNAAMLRDSAEPILQSNTGLRWPIIIYRMLGTLLLALICFPLYRLLDHPETGLAGTQTIPIVDIYYDFMWSGLLLMLTPALVAGLFVQQNTLDRIIERVRSWLLRPPEKTFAAIAALLAFLLASAFSLVVLEGRPNLIDSLAQTLHARWWAAGQLTGPTTDQGGFWAIQNSLFTSRGWISQYPPGHVSVLTPFIYLGIPWAAGPAMAAVTVFFSSLLILRLWVDRPAAARIASLLLATSTFFICIAGSYMNHVTAAAGVAVGAFALLRAWQSNPRWAYLAGFGFAFAFATRPLSTIVMSTAILLFMPAAAVPHPSWAKARAIIWRGVSGGAPLITALLLYNFYFFGHPLRFGYDVALGPQMGLGLHRDPWGNWYGVREAIGYTSSDLITLSGNLFESPLSPLLTIGVFLLIGRGIARSDRLLLAWAAAPVFSNFLYWHHGLFMGPRMLHEATPAWVFLFVAAMVGLYRLLDADRALLGRLQLRPAYAGMFAASFAGTFVFLAPGRANSYGGSWMEIMRVPIPEVREPSLVFVHDSWPGRVVMQLATAGMRLDETETAMRQNSTCRLQHLVDAIHAGDSAGARRLRAGLDLVPRATRLPTPVLIAPGDVMRVVPGDPITAQCLRHIRSDSTGILDLTPLLWRGDLPDGPERGALFVRDLGPERNAELIRRYPRRKPLVYALASPRGHPALYSYEEGMRRLWP
jgi:hypothetical protein